MCELEDGLVRKMNRKRKKRKRKMVVIIVRDNSGHMHGALSISLRCTCDVPAWYTGPCPQWKCIHPTLYTVVIDSPFRYKILTEILPYGAACDSIIIFHIVAGNRPPRPTDTRWLQDHIWNVITTCWSEKQEQRMAIHVIYNQLLVAGVQEIADAGQGN